VLAGINCSCLFGIACRRFNGGNRREGYGVGIEALYKIKSKCSVPCLRIEMTE